MDSLTGEELSRRIRDGDIAAERHLFQVLSPGLRVALRRRTGGDPVLLHDLVQDTLMIVIRRLKSEGLGDPGSLPAFAAQTARFLAIASLRKAQRQERVANSELFAPLPESTLGLQAQAEDREGAMVVRELLRELRHPRDRLVLKRFYLEDCDRDVICRELSLTESTLNQILKRARQRLRQMLEERGFVKSDFLDGGTQVRST
jgi:RNA polymerase sigma-70 factor (ECF subfamily)